MKPAPFRYERPETVGAVLDALGDTDAKVLAGGQSLVPALNMRLVRPTVLVDINHVVDLDNVDVQDGTMAVGALVRQNDPRLRRHPLLAAALPHVGHYVTRNRGTVCGSVAHADAAAELCLCLVLAGGRVVAESKRGRREITAADFFLGPYSTSLEPDELVVETVWPFDGWSYAFDEVAQRRGDFALCMAGAARRNGELRIAVGAVVRHPTLVEVDAARPGESAAVQIETWGNLHAPPEYQRHLVRVLVDRAVDALR
jgi:CO/xanthine dehydrogenase FAD-binding subunit